MSAEDDIYIARRSVDAKRQPVHVFELEELHRVLCNLTPPKSHPYALDRSDYPAFSKLSAYLSTCLGATGTLDGKHCYHISAMSKLLTPDKKYRSLPAIVMPGEAFKYILGEHAKTNAWLPLGIFIGGEYSGPRNVSWWTSLELPNTNLLCSAHRMGLANEDVPLRALVFRCPAEYVHKHALLHVPSVVDAFFSRIFHATFDKDFPKSGLTIDLEDLDNLRTGVDEYVMPPLDIDSAPIEVWPVDRSADSIRHNVFRSEAVSALRGYYERLMAI